MSDEPIYLPITEEEAADLWRQLRREWISPNKRPHLSSLLDRLELVAQQRDWKE